MYALAFNDNEQRIVTVFEDLMNRIIRGKDRNNYKNRVFSAIAYN